MIQELNSTFSDSTDSSIELMNDTLASSDSLLSYTENIFAQRSEENIDTIITYPNFFETGFEASLASEPSLVELAFGQLILLLFTALSLGLLNMLYSREAAMILSTPFRRNGYRKLQEDENLIIRRAQVMLSVIFVFVISVFVFEIFNYLNVKFFPIPFAPFFVTVFLLVASFSLFRYLAASITGYIFGMEDMAEQYNKRQMITNNITALVMLPFMIGLRIAPDPFIPLFAWTGVGVLLIFYCLGLASCADLLWHTEGISKYHLFLYFCTLEIAPFIILFKALSSLN